ncbi:hypothetical protein AGR6A_Cc150022 [Agrobacterium sp. NCPPB 925]|nr:hypothetical protein AGR6A_Cc150022 [Agrobacterium sp. NCPPB 925]
MMSQTGKKQPNPIDEHLGSRIRVRRTMSCFGFRSM